MPRHVLLVGNSNDKLCNSCKGLIDVELMKFLYANVLHRPERQALPKGMMEGVVGKGRSSRGPVKRPNLTVKFL